MKKRHLCMGVAIALVWGLSAGWNLTFAEEGHDHGNEAGKKRQAQKVETPAESGRKAIEPVPSGKNEDHDEAEGMVRLSEEEQKRFGIEVAAVGPGKLADYVSIPGEVTLNADRMAHIVPRLSGVVREVRKNVGDMVRQGEVMAVIESRELADAKAEYLAASERMALARAKFEREERLWRKKISAEQDYLDAKQALAESRIATRSAEQKLHALGFSDDYVRRLPSHPDTSYTRYEIVAPFNATVIEKHITLGETLKEDADAFLVADLDTVWVNLNVYPKDLPQVRQGQEVFIASGQDTPETRGVISYVSPLVKEETRTALARVVLPNPQGLWRSGTFVTARVAVGGEPAGLVLPKTALQTVEDKAVVFVKTTEGFQAKPVTIGRTNETHTEITAGLSTGEHCAVTGTFTLKAQLSKGAFGDGHNH